MTAAELVVRRIVGELARRHPEQGDILVLKWADLGLDSLDVLDLAVRCEEELGVAVPDRVLSRCHSPGEVATHLSHPAGVAGDSAGPEGGDGVDYGVVGV